MDTDEGLIVSCLKGMFAAGSMSGNLLAIHSESLAGQSVTTRLAVVTNYQQNELRQNGTGGYAE